MASTSPSLPIAKGKSEIGIIPKMANRHGLIAGATGTGKTVTLRVMAEQFSNIGVPVFMADVKGDLSGLPFPGGENPKVAERVKQVGLPGFSFQGYPAVFWDVFREQGHPVRATISEMGPLLLSRILNVERRNMPRYDSQDVILIFIQQFFKGIHITRYNLAHDIVVSRATEIICHRIDQSIRRKSLTLLMHLAKSDPIV